MQITVYKNFSKRINSTKVPASGGTALNVVIKDYSNIETPSFTLTVGNIDQNSGFLDVNYVEAFGRKYFATCNVETSTSFSIDCTLDHLATFKSEIQGYSGLVEYTSASSDVSITDPRNNPTLTQLMTKTDFSWQTNPFVSGYPGTYILGVLSDEQTGVGGPCKYYAMDDGGLNNFSANLFSGNPVTVFQDQFANFVDSLVSLIWLPIRYDSIPGSSTVSSIHVGSISKSVGDSSAKTISNRIIDISTGSTNIEFPVWTGAPNIYRTYLAKAPYATYTLYLPFIGWVPISDDVIVDSNSMSIWGTIDILTGDIVYEILSGGSRYCSFNGNIATKVPLAANTYDAIGVATGSLIAIGGAVLTGAGAVSGAGKAITKGLGVMAGGAAAAIKSTELKSMINGSNSSAIGSHIGVNPRLLCIANKPIEPNITAYQSEQGMPYFKTATLSSLSGYIQCADASVSIPGNGAEQSVINGYLNSGFYLE